MQSGEFHAFSICMLFQLWLLPREHMWGWSWES